MCGSCLTLCPIVFVWTVKREPTEPSYWLTNRLIKTLKRILPGGICAGDSTLFGFLLWITISVHKSLRSVPRKIIMRVWLNFWNGVFSTLTSISNKFFFINIFFFAFYRIPALKCWSWSWRELLFITVGFQNMKPELASWPIWESCVSGWCAQGFPPLKFGSNWPFISAIKAGWN